MLQHLPEDVEHLEALGGVFLVGAVLCLARFLIYLVTA
jgi:hypothetical protein